MTSITKQIPTVSTTALQVADCATFFGNEIVVGNRAAFNAACAGAVTAIVATKLAPDQQNLKAADLRTVLENAVRGVLKNVKTAWMYRIVSPSLKLATKLIAKHGFNGVIHDIAESRTPADATAFVVAYLKTVKVDSMEGLAAYLGFKLGRKAGKRQGKSKGKSKGTSLADTQQTAIDAVASAVNSIGKAAAVDKAAADTAATHIADAIGTIVPARVAFVKAALAKATDSELTEILAAVTVEMDKRTKPAESPATETPPTEAAAPAPRQRRRRSA